MMFQADRTDFTLGASTFAPPEIVLSDPQWSLYCLDRINRQALFVKTPGNLDITDSAFLFQSQFTNAQEVLSIDFSTFHQLASTLQPDSSRILFVHSVGRCGSTLMSQVFRALPSTCSLSEPDPATLLTEWRGRRLLEDNESCLLAESSTRFHCKPWPARYPDTRWVFKYRAQCIEIADWLMHAFPNAKQLFIHRQPIEWLKSVYRAFVEPEQHQDPKFAALFEQVWCNYLPFIKEQRIPESPMHISKTWICVWIAVRQRLAQLKSAGLPFYELDYESLKSAPIPTLASMFKALDISVKDWAPIQAALETDSQAGTTIGRDKTKDPLRQAPSDAIAEAITVLKNWGYLCHPSQQAPTNKASGQCHAPGS